MPKHVHAVPKYRRRRGRVYKSGRRESDQAVVTIEGTDHYLGPYGTKASKVEYDRLIGEWLASGRARPQSQDEITVVELSARYWRFAQSYYRKNGRCTRVTPGIKAALRYLKEWYGREPAVEFGPVRLKAIRQKMIEDGHSRRYINDHIDRIRRMYKWAAAEQLIPESAYRALALVEGLRRGRSAARETAPILPVEDEVVTATLPHLPAVVADMVRLQRLTGMRPAEVCLLRPADLNQTCDVWTYRPVSHKTEHHGKRRVVFIGPKAQEILSGYLTRGSTEFCFCPKESEAKRRAEQRANRKTPLGQGNGPGTNRKAQPKWRAGGRYSTDTYRRAVQRACVRAGVGKWSPNQLRHAAATEIRKKFGLEAAQVILGHSAANVTEIYAERDQSKGADVARSVG